MALTVAEGRAMVAASRKYDRVFQTGNMQRSWRNFRHAYKMGSNGDIGVVKEVNVNEGGPVEFIPSEKRSSKSENHYQDWIDAIQKRTRPVADVETGHRTASLCNIVNMAYTLEKPLKWAPAHEKIIDDDNANRMLSRTFRGKWDFTDY